MSESVIPSFGVRVFPKQREGEKGGIQGTTKIKKRKKGEPEEANQGAYISH